MVEIAKEIKNKTDCIKFELAGDGLRCFVIAISPFFIPLPEYGPTP